MPPKTQPSKFGLSSIILLGINTIIGSGIFLLPGIPMSLMGPGSIFIYPLVSIMAIGIALCFAECAGRFNKNGGAYMYAREAFGDFVGFEVGLLKLTVNIVAWAAFAVGFVTALGQLIPFISHDPWYSIAVIVFLMMLMGIQLIGVHCIKIVNNMLSIGKLIILGLFIAVGIFYIDFANFTPLFPQDLEMSNVGSAALTVFFAFSGFESLAIAAEDMKNPTKNLPRAILIVLAICSFIYLLFQVIAIGILGPALANSTSPIYDAAGVVGDWAGWSMGMGTLLSIGGVAFASSYVTPRSACALARDKLLPSQIGTLNDRDVPFRAIVITGGLAIAVALTGSFVTLATISVLARLIQFLPTALAVLVFRKRMPEKSLYVIPFGPLVPLLSIAFTLWLMSNAHFEELCWGAGALLLGIPLYWSMKVWNNPASLKSRLQQKI
ncbi:MAG TPA: APC family permease [Parachlamydiaceae bacterium]|nr:APC family permease [Parachlamydiaceae bacterium]